MQKVGLILEGVGTKGIFTASALDCLQVNSIYLLYVLPVLLEPVMQSIMFLIWMVVLQMKSPIRHAIELGYEKNIVILLKEKGYREKDLPGLKVLSRVLYNTYLKLIESLDSRISRYNESLCYLEALERKGKVFVISPSKVLIDRASSNRNQIHVFYQQGYSLAKDRLEEIKKFIN